MNKEIVYTRKWYPVLEIKERHKYIAIQQIACFIVIEGNGETENFREVYEEFGLDISGFVDRIKNIGYSQLI